MMRVELPPPPSTNNLYRNVAGKGRVKTNRYAIWIRAAGNELNTYGARPHYSGPVRLTITVPKTNRRSDISNSVKAIEDLLVRHGVLDDDSQVDALYVHRVPTGSTVAVSVESVR